MSPSYQPEYFDKLIRLEETNFWFINRNRLILWFIRHYAAQAQSFLEVGCGTGYVLSAIGKAFPALDLCATEQFREGIIHAEKRCRRARFQQIAAEEMNFAGQFDLVGAFDVIEHIENDVSVLQRMHAALKSGGCALFTVPQHPFLWSAADDNALHQRRYTRKELVQKLEGAGFAVLRATSFVSVLLPLMFLSRALRKNKDFDALDEMRIPSFLNRFFLFMLYLERLCIQAGINFPAGGSLLVMARKQ